MKKRLIILISLITMCLASPVAVYAAEEESADAMTETMQEEAVTSAPAAEELSGPVYYHTETHINPLYADVMQASELTQPRYNSSKTYNDVTYYDMSEAVGILRSGMKQRSTTIVVPVMCSDANTVSQELYEAAVSHTGVSDEGDYIRYHYGGYHSSISYSIIGSVTYARVTYTVTYYTDQAQEAEVTTKLNEIMPTLVSSGMSKHDKIEKIYGYICENTAYDYDNLKNDSYKRKYTAYAALIDKKAVCQGYASLFYRMSLWAGVDARLIAGIGNGGNHGWNIVLMDNGLYYNVDSTWDADRGRSPGTYKWFLLCNSSFSDHYRNSEYNTSTFKRTYVMSAVDYDGVTTLPDTDSSDNRNVFLAVMLLSALAAVLARRRAAY